MNNQQIFDVVTAHLLKQNKQCIYNDKLLCAYRNQEGLKCAVGVLIPDSLYDHRMEAYTSPIWLDKEFGILTDLGIKEESFDLLTNLQRVHDNSSPCLWSKQLKYLASKFLLNSDVCTH